MTHLKLPHHIACAVLFAAAFGWPAFAQQQPIYKAPTAADWNALSKLPDFTGVWERGGGGGARGAAPARGAAAGPGAREHGGPSFTPKY